MVGGMGRVADPDTEEALTDVDHGIDRLAHHGVAPAGLDDAYALVRRLDRVNRRVRALQVKVLHEIEQAGLFHADGHASAKVMVRCAANLSSADAHRLESVQRALAALPVVEAAFAQGSIGIGQAERIARTFANRRVRNQLIAIDDHLAVLAARLPYLEFDQKLANWERTEDEDGAGDRAARAHRNRKAQLTGGLDGAWDFLASFGSVQGAEIAEIFGHFVEAQRLADWAEARSRVGEGATADDLLRTEPQRRADAFHAAMRAAASAVANAPGGSIIVTNIVMDLTTFERQLRRVAGTDVEPDIRGNADLAADAAALKPLDLGGEPQPDLAPEHEPVPPPGDDGRVGFRCGTLDGHPLDPAEVTAEALLGHVRRVVVGADGIVVDMGRRTRLFTGPRQLAVKIPQITCCWPGCSAPVSWCQADHLEAFNGSRQGSTCPGNGGPLCGKHNRFKQHGFTVHRDQRGRWHHHRPDGTEIPQPGAE